MNASPQTPAFKASLAKGVTLTRIEGKSVLFSTRTGESYGLNDIGAEMLAKLFAADSLQAAKQIGAEYNAPEAEIHQDLAELVGELAGLKLVEVRK
ncbi:hypothetical protein C3942_20860 [Solimonas fluminis]|uniref:PqqD family protein n=1 Tax=Solimonas fluminis TaxID=2086571 RepID=A0A2S5TAG1_9GAMM|nr:PqqD family peptide modification chaperone [Solimonas fluminis]PPE71993.1 hypothetical protein C3942_20860 [Solimonas fluminis]